MKRSISLGRAQMADEVLEAIAEVLDSGWPGPGPRAEEFEAAFARYCGGTYPVAVNSCTAALHLALRLLDLPPGTEVVTTPITFVATNQVLLYQNLVPVFADIEIDTGHVSVESMEALITENTGALMVMHYAGYPCDIDAVYALADRYSLAVVEDCAHAAGARYRGRVVGSHAGLQAFSFQATKNLSAVDGGLLFVRNEEELHRAMQLRWMGIDSSTHARTGDTVTANEYDVVEVGYRYAMSDLNAAIALVNLKHLDEDNARRRQIADSYTEAFADGAAVRCLSRAPDRNSSHHLYPVLCERRDELAMGLQQLGIVTGRHYKRNDAYRIFSPAQLPAAGYFSEHVLTLPMHPGLSDADVLQVIDAVRACT